MSAQLTCGTGCSRSAHSTHMKAPEATAVQRGRDRGLGTRLSTATPAVARMGAPPPCCMHGRNALAAMPQPVSQCCDRPPASHTAAPRCSHTWCTNWQARCQRPRRPSCSLHAARALTHVLCCSAHGPAGVPAGASRRRPLTQLEGGQEPRRREDVQGGLVQDVENDVEGIPGGGVPGVHRGGADGSASWAHALAARTLARCGNACLGGGRRTGGQGVCLAGMQVRCTPAAHGGDATATLAATTSAPEEHVCRDFQGAAARRLLGRCCCCHCGGQRAARRCCRRTGPPPTLLLVVLPMMQRRLQERRQTRSKRIAVQTGMATSILQAGALPLGE